MQDTSDSLSKCLTLSAELRDFEKLSKVSFVAIVTSHNFMHFCEQLLNFLCEHFVISQFVAVRPSPSISTSEL